MGLYTEERASPEPQGEGSEGAHIEEQVHQDSVASVVASMGVEDLVEHTHTQKRVFGSDELEVWSSGVTQADADDLGHAEKRFPTVASVVGTDRNEEQGLSHRVLAEDESLLSVVQKERQRAVMSEAGQGEVRSLTPYSQ